MKFDTNSKNQNSDTPNSPNALIFLLLLSGRRAGEPWEPLNATTLLLAQQQSVPHFSVNKHSATHWLL
jgi:hypothetical protein